MEPAQREIFEGLYIKEGLILTGGLRRALQCDSQLWPHLKAGAAMPAYRKSIHLSRLVTPWLISPHKRFLLPQIENRQPGFSDTVKPVLNGDGTSLCMSGTPGTGKTCAAYAVAFELCLLHPGWVELIKWTTLLGLCSEVAGFDESAAEAFDELKESSFLIVDDFGRTAVRTDARFHHLFELVDYREERGLPIITTTNLTAAELAETVGEAVLDRISCGLIYKFVGKSLRRES